MALLEAIGSAILLRVRGCWTAAVTELYLEPLLWRTRKPGWIIWCVMAVVMIICLSLEGGQQLGVEGSECRALCVSWLIENIREGGYLELGSDTSW